MEIDADRMLENALRDGIREGIKSKFSQSYQNPADKIISGAIDKHARRSKRRSHDRDA